MAGVTDEESAKKAKPLLEVNAQDIRVGSARITNMPFSEKENLRLGRNYFDELQELQDDYQTQRLRVSGIPGAATVLHDFLHDPMLLTPP